MVSKEEILVEVGKMGRLTPEQEDILYNISLKQDELGREPSNILLSKVKDSPIYQPMLDREFMTYDVFNQGGRHEVACLYVTLKGLRYCMVYGDELASRRKLNPAGGSWKNSSTEKESN